MTDNDITLGEISRTCENLNLQLLNLTKEMREHHFSLTTQVTAMLGPVARLQYQAETMDGNYRRLDEEVNKISGRSAWVSGAIAALGFIAQLVPWPWRHQ